VLFGTGMVREHRSLVAGCLPIGARCQWRIELVRSGESPIRLCSRASARSRRPSCDSLIVCPGGLVRNVPYAYDL
jgi:hypothetical protein